MVRLIFLLIPCFYIISIRLQAALLPNASKQFPEDSLQALLRQSPSDTNQVNIMLKLSQHYISKPGEHPYDLNKALQLSEQAAILSQSLQYYQGLGDCYLISGMALREKGNPELSQPLVQKAIEIFKKHNHPEKAADALVELTNYYPLTKTGLPKKINLNEQAHNLYQKAYKTLKQAQTLKMLGDLYQIDGQSAKAFITLRQALAIYQSLHHRNLHEVYDLMGTVAYEMENYDLALKFGFLAVKVAESEKDTSIFLSTIYNRLGNTFFALEQTEKAGTYFLKGLTIARKYKDKDAVLTLTINMCTLLQKEHKYREALTLLQSAAKQLPQNTIELQTAMAGRFLGIYRNLKQYTTGTQYCNQLLQLTKNKEITVKQQIRAYDQIIAFYLDTKQYAKVRTYLAKNDSLCRHEKSNNYLSRNYLKWFKLDSTQGNYKEAISHYQQYKILRDSTLNEIKSKQTAQLQILYETEKKDQDIKLKQQNIALLQKQNQVQQVKIQQRELQRNSFIVGTTLLLVLSGVIFNRFRLKHQSNQLLETKQKEINLKNQFLEQVLTEKEELLQEKEWMMKEIHHRVKNNLQIISGLLYSQSAYLQDPVALTAIRESQNRVHAMALIHQKLYQSNNLDCVPMQAYIQEIVNHLIQSFNSQNSVGLQLEVAAIDLEISVAVPVGLIINETVTNALKYAFPKGQSGTLSIAFSTEENQSCLLSIADNGIGFPENLKLKQSRTLGLNMIQGLSRQLKGCLEIKHNNGVHISLLFDPKKVIKSQMLPS